jgi:hypothetical protein
MNVQLAVLNFGGIITNLNFSHSLITSHDKTFFSAIP